MKFLFNMSFIIAQVKSFITLAPEAGMVRSVSTESMTRCSSRTSLDDLDTGKTERIRDPGEKLPTDESLKKKKKSALSTLSELGDRPVPPHVEMMVEMAPFVVLGELIAHVRH